MKIILLNILLLSSIFIFSQERKMKSNQNIIDNEYIATEKTKEIIKKRYNYQKNILILTKKENDTINSVFILNNTDKIKTIENQDGSLYLIMEAKDENGYWKPIEYWQRSWCGNSYLSQKLNPNELIKSKTNSYKGTFKTEIRYKFLFENVIYYSNIIKGSINKSQFIIPEIAYEGYNKKVMEIAGKPIFNDLLFLEPYANEKISKKYKEMIEKRKRLKETPQK